MHFLVLFIDVFFYCLDDAAPPTPTQGKIYTQPFSGFASHAIIVNKNNHSADFLCPLIDSIRSTRAMLQFYLYNITVNCWLLIWLTNKGVG